MFTMGDVAMMSHTNEEVLYRLFGINAQLLIDHAWGWEPCTIADIKGYKPENNSLCLGQVLSGPTPCDTARLIVWEMADQMALELVDKGCVTNHISLMIGYDSDSLSDPTEDIAEETDRYGRRVPKHANGSARLEKHTASSRQLTSEATVLFDRIVNHKLLCRYISLTVCEVIPEGEIPAAAPVQLDLFADVSARDEAEKQQEEALAREKKLQQAMLGLKKKFGKNSVLMGTNLEDGATARERNSMIGGHKA